MNKLEQGLRLKKILDYLRINQGELADALKMDKAYLSQVVNGHRSISHSIQSRINETYPKINTHWLMTGTGEMLLKSTPKSHTPIDVKTHLTNEILVIRAKNYANYAKEGVTDYNSENLKLNDSEGILRTFEVTDNYFYPILMKGDLVICQQIQLKSVKSGDFCVIFDKNGVFSIKIIDKIDTILMLYDFKNTSEKVEISEIYEVWQVIKKITTVNINSDAIDILKILTLQNLSILNK
jgi:transcriptional regulator with XRE-family HTH domain